MHKNEFEGKIFTLDNNKEYIILTTYEIEENIYAFMINIQNEKDAMIAKIFYNSDDIYIEELHDSEIIKKIIEKIKDNNCDSK